MKCDKCGKEITDTRKFFCTCGRVIGTIGSINLGFAPFKPYVDDISGDEKVYIDSREKREQVLKERGVRIRDFKQGKYSPTSKIFAVSGNHTSGRSVNVPYGGG